MREKLLPHEIKALAQGALYLSTDRCQLDKEASAVVCLYINVVSAGEYRISYGTRCSFGVLYKRSFVFFMRQKR